LDSVDQHTPDVFDALNALKQQLRIVQSIRQPNRPIKNFEIPAAEFMADWLDRLSKVTRDTAIGETSEFLKSIEQPTLDSEERDHTHYEIYYEISQLRRTADILIQRASEAGYPKGDSFSVAAEDISGDIRDIKSLLSSVQAKVTELESASKSTLSQGVSFSLGPVSVSYETLKESISAARRMIVEKADIDVGELALALPRIADSARFLLEEFRRIYGELPNGLLKVLSEIISLGTELAKRGLSLLEGVVKKRDEGDADSIAANQSNAKFAASGIVWSLSNNFSIDLGSHRTRIFRQGVGLVLDEPSLVAFSVSGAIRKVVAVGLDAQKYEYTSDPKIDVVYPLKDGVVADVVSTHLMIKALVKKTFGAGRLLVLPNPQVIATIPAGATTVERRAVADAVSLSGAKRVFLIEAPTAAAIGAKLPVHGDAASLVVLIGAGQTEIAVLALGGLVYCRSIRSAGDNWTDDIVKYFRRNHNLLINRSDAENLKKVYGSAVADEKFSETLMRVSGHHLMDGTPKDVSVSKLDLSNALCVVTEEIVEGIKVALEATPPELAADIVSSGICLTGGGALLADLPKAIQAEIGLNVFVAEMPENCAVEGAGVALEHLKSMKQVLDEIV
tara:strand:- start:1174 stop:3030 length:1857 start_codon:yes stop_codon:yes gene_type:complete